MLIIKVTVNNEIGERNEHNTNIHCIKRYFAESLKKSPHIAMTYLKVL